MFLQGYTRTTPYQFLQVNVTELYLCAFISSGLLIKYTVTTVIFPGVSGEGQVGLLGKL